MWSPNVVRHHLALPVEPLQPPLRSRQRCPCQRPPSFQWRPQQIAPFRTQDACGHVVFQTWLWCIDWCHESVSCAAVTCAHICCLWQISWQEHFFIKRDQNRHIDNLFCLLSPSPFTTLRFLQKKSLLELSDAWHTGKTGVPKRKGLSKLAGHPVLSLLSYSSRCLRRSSETTSEQWYFYLRSHDDVTFQNQKGTTSWTQVGKKHRSTISRQSRGRFEKCHKERLQYHSSTVSRWWHIPCENDWTKIEGRRYSQTMWRSTDWLCPLYECYWKPTLGKHLFRQEKLWRCSKYWQKQRILWLYRSNERNATCSRRRSICNQTETTTAAATTAAAAHSHVKVELLQMESPIMECSSMAVIVQISLERALLNRWWHLFSRSTRTRTSEDKRSYPFKEHGGNPSRFFSLCPSDTARSTFDYQAALLPPQ